MKNSIQKTKKKVYAYLHTHWDREWYREFEEFHIRLIEVFDDVLKKLDKKEIETFYFDGQTCALQDYLEIKPQKHALIKKFIKEKRLFIGPYYCSTDSFLADGEALIKNLQMGILCSQEFGCNDFIAYHADTFGHSAHLPQVVKYFDIKNAIFWRGLGELESEFKFNGLKSTYLIEGYFHDYFSSEVSCEKKAELLKRTLDRISKYSSDNILLPLGADHLSVPDNIKEQVKEVNSLLEDYEIILSDPFEYLKQVENNYKRNICHEFRDTKRNFILPGVLSSRIDLKQLNSKYQWELARKTQPLQAICAFLDKSASFQSETDYLYKLLIDNHPHDSIYGCSVDNVHEENKMRFKKVSQGSNAILNSLRRDLFTKDVLSVINLSNFKLNGALKIISDRKPDKKYNAQLIGTSDGFPLNKVYSINQIPVTEDYTKLFEYLVDVKNIDAFSTKKLEKGNINLESNLKITNNSVENDKIGLSVENGKINITDKSNRKVFKNFIQFIDRADIGDSYNFGALKNDTSLESKIIKSRIKENGHIRCVLEIEHELYIPAFSNENGRSKVTKRHRLKTDIILENQNDFFELDTVWTNKSKNHLLQIKFNMENPVTYTYSDDIAGYIKRDFDPNYDIYKLLPAPRGVELKHNIAPMQKCLWTQGFGLITQGLQEYEIYKNELRLTLLRATGTISNPHNPTRGTPAGPPLPTPDLQMQVINRARFAICFKSNVGLLEENVEKFYNASTLLFADLKNTKLFCSGNKNILVSTVKLTSENDLIVRFINKSDKEEELRFSTKLTHSGIFITDALENQVRNYSDHKINANSFVTLLIKKS